MENTDMLWLKAWLETRWRLVFALAMLLPGLALILASGHDARRDPNAMLANIGFMCVFASIFLAGDGIQTQYVFRGSGVHGSIIFTLTLPVSRLRLLIVRTVCGLLETVGLIAIVSCGIWLISRNARATFPGNGSTPTDLLKMIVECCSFGIAVHLLSVHFATFLDAAWQLVGTIFAVMALGFLDAHLNLPRSIDSFRLMIGDNPLVTHTLFWGRIAVSITLSLILFFAAARIAQTREY
jgi:hypothetical protein